jgi:hypothetical protein
LKKIYFSRKWKCGNLEPHPTERAIIINYQLEASVLGSKQQSPMLEEKKVIKVAEKIVSQPLSIKVIIDFSSDS